MHVKELPFEIVSEILVEVAEANIRDGPTYTFGLTQAPLPIQKAALQRYVRGPVSQEMLKWDATSVVRHACWQWHEWATQYALKSVSVSRRRGGEVSTRDIAVVVYRPDKFAAMGRAFQPAIELFALRAHRSPKRYRCLSRSARFAQTDS